MILVLVLGFGFVIFFHELGHFLAAKWVGIKVEQFAIGFGHAIVAWRKGVGIRFGNTQKDYQQRLLAYLSQRHPGDTPNPKLESFTGEESMRAERELGLGETEYRLNWIPLGGYVKMLGQDDLRPNAQADDPRSYNRKSVGARMIVVSAGVVMNVILAGIGFMALFLIGFHVPPAWVGSIASGSPAESAVKIVNGKPVPFPIRSGDQIISYEGKPQEDFTKIGLNTALSAEGAAQSIRVRHPDGTEDTLQITPLPDPTSSGFLSIGIAPPHLLAGLEEVDPESLKIAKELSMPDVTAVGPAQTITQIDGQDVKAAEYWKLDEAMQNPDGHRVVLTVRDDASGQTRRITVQPHFGPIFGGGEIDIAGMNPRAMITGILPESAARNKLSPGDVVLAITIGPDSRQNPSSGEFRARIKDAGENGGIVDLLVLRPGEKSPVQVSNLAASAKIENAKGKSSRGLGVTLGYDEMHAVVAGVVKDSPAENAGIPKDATITAVGKNKVSTWFEVQHYLGQAKPDAPIVIHFVTSSGPGQAELRLTEADVLRIRGLLRGSDLMLRDLIIIRQARDANGRLDPLKAAYWGVTETRDFILQFYLTLRRMAGGSVSPDQLMGPVGIFVGGARFAVKGTDWLLWFLSMISANLAVVNFLPIPIVDGGLFTFLILEKIQGRPLSPRTQAIAQYVGLAFLAGVFLFVTYHDILRFIPHA